jgi:hypothetical protein
MAAQRRIPRHVAPRLARPGNPACDPRQPCYNPAMFEDGPKTVLVLYVRYEEAMDEVRGSSRPRDLMERMTHG